MGAGGFMVARSWNSQESDAKAVISPNGSLGQGGRLIQLKTSRVAWPLRLQGPSSRTPSSAHGSGRRSPRRVRLFSPSGWPWQGSITRQTRDSRRPGGELETEHAVLVCRPDTPRANRLRLTTRTAGASWAALSMISRGLSSAFEPNGVVRAGRTGPLQNGGEVPRLRY
jgi:hypothetical protein